LDGCQDSPSPHLLSKCDAVVSSAEPVVSVSHETQLLNSHELLTVGSHLGPFVTAGFKVQDGQPGKIYEATLSCSECDSISFCLELTEGVAMNRLNVKRVCPHFPWVYDAARSARYLFSLMEPSTERPAMLTLILKKVWRLGAFPEEIADNARSFHSRSYKSQIQAQISGYQSFNAMLAKTPGNWFILTNREHLDFDESDQFILGWVAPWAIPCSARCAYYQLHGSFRVSHPCVYSIPIAIENNESFPLGFCIAPSESIARESTFFDDLFS
jgi:hypothetical protein